MVIINQRPISDYEFRSIVQGRIDTLIGSLVFSLSLTGPSPGLIYIPAPACRSSSQDNQAGLSSHSGGL